MKAEALDSILTAIRKVLKGEPYLSSKFSERLVFKAIRSMDEGLGSPVDKLSDRELEVLNLMGRGFGAQDIANEMHLSVKTIETHRAHIKEKLGFHDSKKWCASPSSGSRSSTPRRAPRRSLSFWVFRS